MSKQSIQEKYNLPRDLKVLAKKDSQGGFVIKLADYSGAITYAENAGEFVGVLNDLVLTYFDVPRKEAEKVDFSYVPKHIGSCKPNKNLQRTAISESRDFVPYSPCYV